VDLELAGKVALITGSSSGIGLAIAKGLKHEGCKVALNGRDKKKLEGVSQQLRQTAFPADVTDPDQCRELADAVVQQFGRIDVLVCNVGSGASVPPGQETHDEWRRMIDLNLLSAANTVAAARRYLAAVHGVVLCISSICGWESLGCPIAYSAAKAALHSFVHGMARPLGRDGIRINALAPGNVLFPGSTWERKLDQDAAGVETMLARDVALGRLGTVAEIADFSIFLCSPRSAFATGGVFIVDGGQVRS
jgi:3-oxoacyl-[acyl-carrier protein] reductase